MLAYKSAMGKAAHKNNKRGKSPSMTIYAVDNNTQSQQLPEEAQVRRKRKENLSQAVAYIRVITEPKSESLNSNPASRNLFAWTR